MNTVLQTIAIILASVGIITSVPLFRRFRWPSPLMWMFKLYASATSLIFLAIGLLCATVGLLTDSLFITLISLYNVVVFSFHVYKVSQPPEFSNGFAEAFGLDWKKRIKGRKRMRSALLPLPRVPDPKFEKDISFGTIPGSNRKLLCDIWQPADHIARSGLAFIYMHGSAWYFLDKDLGTRPFFRHLTAQGHVIMDVAHRLAPETDLMGMVHDVKRAIAWMRENANKYGIDPAQLAVGGGSAGGHLAMMAAYTANRTAFTPIELLDKDLSCCAVISMYGPGDLETMYYHLNQHLTTRSTPGKPTKTVRTGMPEWIKKKMGAEYFRLGFDRGFENAGTFAPLMGGHPDEYPERYALFSPINHTHSDCPPTLLIHGEHDIMAPANVTPILYAHLADQKVPVVMHIIPQSDHAFDLILPKISVSAHNAIRDVDNFLSLILVKQKMETRVLDRLNTKEEPVFEMDNTILM